MRMSLLTWGIIAAAVGLAGTASAGLITPLGVSFTGTATELGGLNLDNETNIINGNGLSAALAPDGSNVASVTHAAVSFSAPGNAWVTTDPGGFPSDWFAESGQTVVFEFDLDTIYRIREFASWGYHFGADNGNSVSSVTFDFSTDGGATIDSSQTVAVPLPGAFDAASVVSIAPANADFIRMTVTDNHFGNATGGDRVGLAEVRFLGDVVPEPTSLVVLSGALLALLAVRRGAFC